MYVLHSVPFCFTQRSMAHINHHKSHLEQFWIRRHIPREIAMPKKHTCSRLFASGARFTFSVHPVLLDEGRTCLNRETSTYIQEHINTVCSFYNTQQHVRVFRTRTSNSSSLLLLFFIFRITQSRRVFSKITR